MKEHLNQRSAFTLIEMLISGALMALILASAYACLSAGVTTQRLVEARSDATQTARVAVGMIAADLRKRRPKPHTSWHLDEVYLKIDGRMVYLWRAVDAEGEILDVLVQSKRDKHAALKLMRKLLKKYGFVPDRLITDDLRSYGAAAMSVVGGRIIERRTRISRPDDESARCRASKAEDQPNDSSQPMQPSTTPSTSNAI